MRILTIFGTRPEAIKMAPVIKAFKKRSGEDSIKVCVTGQHRQMLDEVLQLFSIRPDYDLNIMRLDQNLTDVLCTAVKSLQTILQTVQPTLVLVQGDTTTTFSAALAAYYARIPVAHIEAGLRTHDIYSPWPEEAHRALTSRIAAIHFAPSLLAAKNLRREGIPEKDISVTGNTVIDAVLEISQLLQTNPYLAHKVKSKINFTDKNKKMILVTVHRRENFGMGIHQICRALKKIAARPDVQIIFPVHPNPKIHLPVYAQLQNHPNIKLIDPLNYLDFIYLMQQSYFILTDSGGIQEEAPALGKPVLLMRDATERPEAILAGTVKMIGTQEDKIIAETHRILDDKMLYVQMSRPHNVYGEGNASQQIVNQLLALKLSEASLAAYN